MSSGISSEGSAEKGDLPDSCNGNSHKCTNSGDGKQGDEGACNSNAVSVDKESEARSLSNKEKQGVLDFRDKTDVAQNSEDEAKQPETEIGITKCEHSSDVNNQQHQFKELCGKRKNSQLCSSKCNDGIGLNDVMQCCSKKRKRCERKPAFYNCKFQESALTCVGILPGMGSFIDSSDDSDQSGSSGSESNEKYDLVGRRIEDSKADASQGRVIPRLQLKCDMMDHSKSQRFYSHS